MKQDKVIELKKPEETFQDVLTEVLRRGAQEAIIKAVQGEFKMFMDTMSGLVDEQGRWQVVCNGRTDERAIQTPLGSLKVSVPRCKDKRKAPREQKVRFTSALLPPYLKRTKQLDELLPLLYLKGLSTGDFAEALSVLLGKNASGLSPSTISRMTREWQADWEEWQQRDLSGKEYVYFWADGVFFQARLEEAKQCVLVIVGALQNGAKEVVAIWDGYRESTASWTELMLDLQKRGLMQPPKLAVGDGALGFWNALSKVFGSTRAQRCWLHKTGNVLNKLPKGIQAKAKNHLHQIWIARPRWLQRKHSISFCRPTTKNIRKPLTVWQRIEIACSPFTIFQPSIGRIYARPIRLNRCSQRSDNARTKPRTAYREAPCSRWYSNSAWLHKSAGAS